MPDLSILLEAYRGKKSEFPEIEKQLKILINTIRQNTKRIGELKSINDPVLDTHNLPENKELEKLLAKAFNLREVNVYWKPNMYNAMTMPPILPKINQLNKNLDDGSTITNARIDIYIGEKIIELTTINEKELLGIILHEIGHCHTMSPIMNFIRAMHMTLFLPLVLFEKLMVFTGLKFDEFVRKYLPKLYNLRKWYTGLQIEALHPVMKLMNVGGKVDLSMWIPPASVIMYGQYSEEKSADSFAVSYGYGPHVISGLDKMVKVDNSIGSKTIAKNNMTRILSDSADLYMSLMCVLTLEPHPSINARYHNALRQLKEDLQDPELDPSYKKEMLQQIKEMEEIYEKLGKMDGDGVNFKYKVNTIIDKLTGNKPDFREAFNKVYSDKYRF